MEITEELAKLKAEMKHYRHWATIHQDEANRQKAQATQFLERAERNRQRIAELRHR